MVGGLLVDFDELIGVGGGVGTFTTLSVAGANIRRIELYQPLNVEGGSDGILFDDANFTLARALEPGTLAILGLGLEGLGLVRRKRAA